MKKLLQILLTAALCTALLSACGGAPAGNDAGSSLTDASAAGSERPDAPGEAGGAKPLPDGAVLKPCRVVGAYDDGTLLLAEADGSGIYMMNPAGIEPTIDGAPAAAADTIYTPGTMLAVAYDGMILETYPAQFSNIVGLDLRSDGFDDLCRLYLEVLEDLWEVDPGLNGDLTYIGMDLSKTRLTPSERAAVAWLVAIRHGAEAVEGTFDQLVEQGYITGEPLEGSDARFYQWEDGLLFTIEEQPEDADPSDSLRFDAKKWRTGLGAYYFADCTAQLDARSSWGDYQVGAEMIS